MGTTNKCLKLHTQILTVY